MTTPEPAADGERDRANDRLGPYTILEQIGAGGMGRVYLVPRASR